ncbi:MAG: hypothetical protein PVF27_08370 [Gemmatimonadales bacterium]|jgi:hypothetical protein
MESLFPVLKFLHVMAFVFMSVPLFNLIVVNERAQLGAGFDYSADRYMENIIRRGATRCFVFQWTVLITGVLLVVVSPFGIEALWTNGVLLAKTVLLLALMGLLSYVHYGLQPRIEAILAQVHPEGPIPEDLPARLKPYRVRRKRLATVCLFLVIVTIVLGLQVYERFGTGYTAALIGLAALFAWRVNRTLARFGWI